MYTDKHETQKDSKMFKTLDKQQNINSQLPFGSDLPSNNPNESFFLDISKLKSNIYLKCFYYNSIV